jgi:hypothetical protein
MNSTALLSPSEQLAHLVQEQVSSPVLHFEAELLTQALFEEVGALGLLVYEQRAPYQPPAPRPLEHWDLFLGLLSSNNTNETVHAHLTVAELYGVFQGRLLLHVWAGNKQTTVELGPGSLGVVKPGYFHYVEWDQAEGPGWAFAVKAPNLDPRDPGSKVVAPVFNPASLNGLPVPC